MSKLDLSTAQQEAFIEKDHPQFCTVYLRGKPTKDNIFGAPKVIGIDHVNKTDFEIIEEAVTTFNQSERC